MWRERHFGSVVVDFRQTSKALRPAGKSVERQDLELPDQQVSEQRTDFEGQNWFRDQKRFSVVVKNTVKRVLNSTLYDVIMLSVGI